MNQRQLQAFRLVLQNGSITTAAQALRITQPAMSRLIADLERSLGFALFRREGGKITPTVEAIEFGREVDHMYFGMDRLRQIAREIKELRRASLYVATMPMISFEIMPRAITAFLVHHQGIRLTHNVHTSARIVDLVTSRQIELGIAHSHVNPGNVDTIASYRTHFVCAMHPSHRLTAKKVITPADLDGEPFIGLSLQAQTSNDISRHLADANAAPDILVQTQPSYSACGLVAQGLGITIVDPMTPKVFGPALKILPFKPEVPFDFHLIKARGAKLSQAAQEFATYIMAEIGRTDSMALRDASGRRAAPPA